MLLYIHNDAWAFRVTVFEKDSGTNIFVHDGATIGTHDVSDWATWPNWRSVLVMVSRMVYWLDWWFPRTYRQPLGPVLKTSVSARHFAGHLRCKQVIIVNGLMEHGILKFF